MPKKQDSLNNNIMKKFAVIGVILIFGYCVQAQVSPHAIGLRLGGNGDINGAEISYQHGLSSINRLEFDLGFGSSKNHNRMFLSGIYQWDWNIASGLNWYVGPGATLGLYSYDNNDNYLNIGIGGQIGLEYNFSAQNAPILLSIDARPMWDFIGDNSGLGWGAALGIRYLW